MRASTAAIAALITGLSLACDGTTFDATAPGVASGAARDAGSVRQTGDDAGVQPPGDTDVCAPNCQMKICGPDGCGGSCGECESGSTCTDGRCFCVPESDSKFCERQLAKCGQLTGTDNCGRPRSVASCGDCGSPQTCGGGAVAGQCGCTPQCSGKACGPDGCGRTCGTCPANSLCSPNQKGCDCTQGFLPNPDGTACLQSGSSASALAALTSLPINGYCLGGRRWVIPDRVRGLLDIDCGENQCRPDSNGGLSGSCTCGGGGTAFVSLTNAGFCPSGASLGNGFGAHEVWMTCYAGNAYYFNCIQYTGQQTGVCSSFVTAYGSIANCHCAPCAAFNPQNGSCSPFCPSSQRCFYDAQISTHTCL